MKKALLLLSILSIGFASFVLAGCSGSEEDSAAPAVADINKGLEGVPGPTGDPVPAPGGGGKKGG